MKNFKRIKQLDKGCYVAFDGINYSIYYKKDNEIIAQVFLTIEDIDKINEFVFLVEKQSLE